MSLVNWPRRRPCSDQKTLSSTSAIQRALEYDTRHRVTTCKRLRADIVLAMAVLRSVAQVTNLVESAFWLSVFAL